MRTVIVGGVAGGMSAAARLRRLDERHEIIVLERGHHVSYANCGLPYHIGGVIEDQEALLLQTRRGFTPVSRWTSESTPRCWRSTARTRRSRSSSARPGSATSLHGTGWSFPRARPRSCRTCQVSNVRSLCGRSGTWNGSSLPSTTGAPRARSW